MTQSTYRVTLVSDATRSSTKYLQHYGVKGMKWGVVHDEEEKQRQWSQSAMKGVFVAPRTPAGPMMPKIERDRRLANETGKTVTRTLRYRHGDVVIKTQPDHKQNSKEGNFKNASSTAMKIIDDLPADSKQKLESATKDFLKSKDGKQLQNKINDIITNSSGEINDDTVQEIMGVAVDMVQSEELMEATEELMDTVKDVALDELEKENPTLGKTAKAVDNFIDGVKDFVADFTQSVQNIISGISNWFEKLFSK